MILHVAAIYSQSMLQNHCYLNLIQSNHYYSKILEERNTRLEKKKCVKKEISKIIPLMGWKRWNC